MYSGSHAFNADVFAGLTLQLAGAAIAVSRDTDSIIKYLKMLCKTEVPAEVESYIRSCTQTFGKAKLVLKDNKYFIESKFPDVLRELLKNPVISAARIQTSTEQQQQGSSTLPAGLQSIQTVNKEGFVESMAPMEDRRNVDFVALDEDDANDDELVDESSLASANAAKTVSFMVNQEMLKVQRCYFCGINYGHHYCQVQVSFALA